MAFICASWQSQSTSSRERIWSHSGPGTCTTFKLCRCTNARLCTRPNILARLCWGRACANCLNPNLAISITNNRLTWIQWCKCIVAGKQETVLTILGNTVKYISDPGHTTFYRIHWRHSVAARFEKCLICWCRASWSLNLIEWFLTYVWIVANWWLFHQVGKLMCRQTSRSRSLLGRLTYYSILDCALYRNAKGSSIYKKLAMSMGFIWLLDTSS